MCGFTDSFHSYVLHNQNRLSVQPRSLSIVSNGGKIASGLCMVSVFEALSGVLGEHWNVFVVCKGFFSQPENFSISDSLIFLFCWLFLESFTQCKWALHLCVNISFR